MAKSLSIVIAVVLASVMSLGCEEKMSEQWCEDMMLKPNKQWTEKEAKLFARDCLEP